MKVNLKKAEKSILKVLDKGFNFDTETKYDDDCVNVTASGITLNGIDDDIMLKVSVSEDGTMIINAILDKLPINPSTVQMLADYNYNSLFFKAYTSSEEHFLYISYNALYVSNDLIEDTVNGYLNVFASKRNIEIMQDLCAETN